MLGKGWGRGSNAMWLFMVELKAQHMCSMDHETTQTRLFNSGILQYHCPQYPSNVFYPLTQRRPLIHVLPQWASLTDQSSHR